MAYEIFKAHDTNVSYRGPIAIDECIVFGSSGYIRAPSGDYWRFMKKIIMAKALGPQALERTRGVRLVELERFHRNLLDKAMKKESVEIGEEAMRLVNNTLGKMSMGSSFSVEDNDGGKVCELSVAFTSLCHKFCVAQVFHKPLEKLGISFLKKDVMEVSHRFEEHLENILAKYEEKVEEHQGAEFMDALLESYQGENAEYKMTRKQIKALFAVTLSLRIKQIPLYSRPHLGNSRMKYWLCPPLSKLLEVFYINKDFQIMNFFFFLIKLLNKCLYP